MIGSQRFEALMNGQLPDRVPVACNMLEQGARELGLSIKEYYSRGEYVAEGQLRLREKYGYDLLWGGHYTAKDAELLGSKKTIFVDNGPPNVGHLVARKTEEMEKLVIPEDIYSHPGFQEELTTIEILKKELGGRYPVASFVVGSFSMPPILMGMDKWLDIILTGPVSLRRSVLEKCSDYCLKRVTALRRAGVDMISYSNPMATTAFLSPTQFEDLALEWIEKDFNAFGPHGMVYFNGGGRLNPFIDAIIRKTNVGAVYIHPFDNVVEAKKLIDGRALLAAPINDIQLIRWSRPEIEFEVERIMTAGADGGGFIFGTLVMPFGIPEDNIRIMLEAAYRYGTYCR